MKFLVYIAAGHDRNGNPRRGWIEYLAIEGSYAKEMAFHDEGYAGLPKELENVPVTGRFEVTPAEYKHWKRWESARVAERDQRTKVGGMARI